MQPLVGIELDDKSHQREDRRERDAFVDQVFAAATLPLLHVTAKRAYVVEEIAAQIEPYIAAEARAPEKSAAPASLQPPSPTPSNGAPRCPKCGSEMILRTAKSGVNAGKRFWGCSTYPSCRGMLSSTV